MAKYQRKNKQNLTLDASERKKYLRWSILIPVVLIFVFILWNYRHSLHYYYNVLFNKELRKTDSEKNKHDARNILLMDSHDDNSFGIDVSQYQGNILWDSVNLINNKFPIDFVFVRATMGEKSRDSKFKKNWNAIKSIHKLRGAYHYFRPNENSIKQANNFIKTVKLSPGDLPPVLDIEERPRDQSMDSLRVGLKRWLDRVEEHYKVRPIVYSGDSYFTDFLEKEFKDYKLWIANYNFWVESPKVHWDIWQFSEKGSVKGIKGFVDLNMYRSDIEDLEKLTIPYE
ncbi:glycoside hydrolase family 25 protein [Sphingobacterium bovistauri]|uniref:Glycoside hydrolase family 25 protein n=1 Tax=Sphingobacterium bovistauri TaxID=2781959 RepID=A0ABS7Z0A0_9SPHI|nr:glycoside hydrolase family 25 protein [Sphingobacterium bovistauri]MCA5003589.1 glycoside hydrolase family 25 protein [Sphingobacterium bovistauri]